MKKTLVLLLVLLAFASVYAESYNIQAGDKVWILGDSNTRGKFGEAYRSWLKSIYGNDFDFVGSGRSTTGGTFWTPSANGGTNWSAFPEVDNRLKTNGVINRDHEGYGGRQLSQVYDNTMNVVQGDTHHAWNMLVDLDAKGDLPTHVIIFLGTNDFIYNNPTNPDFTPAALKGKYTDIIWAIATYYAYEAGYNFPVFAPVAIHNFNSTGTNNAGVTYGSYYSPASGTVNYYVAQYRDAVAQMNTEFKSNWWYDGTYPCMHPGNIIQSDLGDHCHFDVSDYAYDDGAYWPAYFIYKALSWTGY